MKIKKKLNTKDFIVQCAFVLFLEKGYKEVTLINIMELTNLSKGAIYHYFGSKEEIYNETLYVYYFNLLNAKGLDLTSDSFRENVKSLYSFIAVMFGKIEHLTQKKISYPIRNFYSYQLESEHNELLRSTAQKIILEHQKKIEHFVIHAIELGEISKTHNVEAVVLQIMGMVEGLAVHHSTIKENVKEELMKKYRLAFDNYLELICLN